MVIVTVGSQLKKLWNMALLITFKNLLLHQPALARSKEKDYE